MSGLGLTFLRRGGQAHPTAESDYIFSENRGDPEVFRILMSKGVSSDGVGITKDDAAKVTSIGTWFQGNSTIKNFDEFRFFESVTDIVGTQWNNGAFYKCTNLRSCQLPNSITCIGVGAFMGCSSLQSISIPQSVNTIKEDAFGGCPFIMDRLELPNLTTLGNIAFPIAKIRELILPNLPQMPIKTLWSQKAWGDASVLEYIDISSVSLLRDDAFNSYKALRYCDASNVSQVNIGVFGGCVSLNTLLLGNVTAMGKNAITNAVPLEVLVLRSVTPPSMGTGIAFSTTVTIYVPDASVDAFKVDSWWSAYASQIKPLSEYNG